MYEIVTTFITKYNGNKPKYSSIRESLNKFVK